MTRIENFRSGGLRRMLMAGAFSAASLAAAPALADTYYYDAPPVVEQGPTTTSTTTTYSYTQTPSAPVYYEHEHDRDRDRDRDHGAGLHVDTPILNFGIGIH
ncbi:MAG TPA: hypothetical protein VKU84_19645 [Stellaceae bacterium]|nr:hypothetical protein [Stellaceae bacterium]